MSTARTAATGVTATSMAAVAVGAIAGTGARYAIVVAMPAAAGTIPWATLTVNVAGSLALGVLSGILVRRFAAPWVRPLLGTGLLGSFTTYSTFAVEVNGLLALRPAMTIVYLVASLTLGCAAAAVGLWVAQR